MHHAFQVHTLNEQGKGTAGVIACKFHELLSALEALVPTPDRDSPGSREMAILRTKLEEACFFAKKAMASNPANCTPGEAP
jgi:hypothetical protein